MTDVMQVFLPYFTQKSTNGLAFCVTMTILTTFFIILYIHSG